LNLLDFRRTYAKKHAKNVFEENMIVYVPRTASLRLKLYFLMQRAFAENLQEVILFSIKTA